MKRQYSNTHVEKSRPNTKRSKGILYAPYIPGEIWLNIWNDLNYYVHVSQNNTKYMIMPDIFALKITCKYFYHSIRLYLIRINNMYQGKNRISVHALSTVIECFKDGKLNCKVAEYYVGEIFKKTNIYNTSVWGGWKAYEWKKCIISINTCYNNGEQNEIKYIINALLSKDLIDAPKLLKYVSNNKIDNQDLLKLIMTKLPSQYQIDFCCLTNLNYDMKTGANDHTIRFNTISMNPELMSRYESIITYHNVNQHNNIKFCFCDRSFYHRCKNKICYVIENGQIDEIISVCEWINLNINIIFTRAIMTYLDYLKTSLRDHILSYANHILSYINGFIHILSISICNKDNQTIYQLYDLLDPLAIGMVAIKRIDIELFKLYTKRSSLIQEDTYTEQSTMLRIAMINNMMKRRAFDY